MQCDICDAPGAGVRVRAREFSRAVRAGFNPFQEGLAQDQWGGDTLMSKSGYQIWRDDSISGIKSMSDWNICYRCIGPLERYLPDIEGMSEAKPSDTPEDIESRLAAVLREELRNDFVESYADEAGNMIAAEVVQTLGKERAHRAGVKALKSDALARLFIRMNRGAPSGEPISRIIARDLADIYIPKWWQFWRK